MALTSTREETIAIEKLKGTENFQLWEFQIQIVFRAQSLHSVANGITVKPEAAEAAEEWMQKDAKAQRIIISSIERTPMMHILNCTTSAEMIKKLKAIFQKDTEEQKYKLLQEFFNFGYNVKNDIAVHISKIQDIAFRLKALDPDSTINDTMVITKILTILPEKFKYFLSAWESTPIKERTMDNLLSRLQTEEQRSLKSGEREDGGTSNVAFKTEIRRCFGCGSTGHIKRDCKQSSSNRNKDFVRQEA